MSDDKLLDDWKDDEEEELVFDTKKARKMIRRTRLRLIWSVVSTVLGVIFLYALYKMGIMMYYDLNSHGREFDRAVAEVVEAHNPGLFVEKMGLSKAEVSTFLTQSTTLKLYRQVGDLDVVAGEVRARKPLFGKMEIEYDLERRYLDHNQNFSFRIPLELLGSTYTPMYRPDEQPWKRMKMIDDGNVVEMAFSTKKGMKPLELFNLLKPYNLGISEMAVYAGEIREVKTSYSGADGEWSADHFNLRPYIRYTETYDGSQMAHWLDTAETVETSEKQMLEDLEWMLANVEYMDHDTDQQRLDYLKKHGVVVYGAVVTGPVRELEKLKDNPNLRHFQLGGIEPWSWSLVPTQ